MYWVCYFIGDCKWSIVKYENIVGYLVKLVLLMNKFVVIFVMINMYVWNIIDKVKIKL